MVALPRPCLESRCPALATYRGRCAEHARAYDLRRGSSAERGPYNTARHKEWRRAVIVRDRVCRDCGCALLDGKGEPLPNAHADHVVPITEGGQAFSLANGAARCHRDHSRKTMRELRARGRVA